MTRQQTHSLSLAIIGLLMTFSLVLASTVVTPAYAIKRFFNCMTDVANKYGKLTINDVNLCYDKEYHSGSYATHTHSHSAIGTSSTPGSK